jgi:long-subunit acyl-CoA synthetase (AMP-forming)
MNHVSDGDDSFSVIGVFSKNNDKWAITDLACCFSDITNVTLYDTLGAESTVYIIT